MSRCRWGATCLVIWSSNKLPIPFHGTLETMSKNVFIYCPCHRRRGATPPPPHLCPAAARMDMQTFHSPFPQPQASRRIYDRVNTLMSWYWASFAYPFDYLCLCVSGQWTSWPQLRSIARIESSVELTRELSSVAGRQPVIEVPPYFLFSISDERHAGVVFRVQSWLVEVLVQEARTMRTNHSCGGIQPWELVHRLNGSSDRVIHFPLAVALTYILWSHRSRRCRTVYEYTTVQKILAGTKQTLDRDALGHVVDSELKLFYYPSLFPGDAKEIHDLLCFRGVGAQRLMAQKATE